MDAAIVDRLAAVRTIEITTTGRRSGKPVRVEIWWFHVDGRFIITGTPGPRDWLANLIVDPRLTVHALGHDYPATARLVADPDFRRRFFSRPGQEIGWYLAEADYDDLVRHAPMVEVRLEARAEP